MKLSCVFGHKWNGCTCKGCGRVRDEGHDWNGCKCKICGKTRDAHSYFFRPWGGECERRCRTCDSVVRLEHAYQPTEQKCHFKCTRCGYETIRHDKKPIPDRCADVCSVCGIEWDYLEIAKDKYHRDFKEAIERIKKADMLGALEEFCCARGEHIWTVIKENPQQFRGGTSSQELRCEVCGKTMWEMDYGD